MTDQERVANIINNLHKAINKPMFKVWAADDNYEVYIAYEDGTLFIN